jgi:hypothetical protein
MDTVLNSWFLQILEAVESSKKRQQRHKKVFVDRSGKSVALRKMPTDATSTYYASKYQNVNGAAIVGKIMGDPEGSEIALHCFSDRPRADLLLQEIANREIAAGLSQEAFDNTASHLKSMLYMRESIFDLVTHYGANLRHNRPHYLENLQVQFLMRLCLPPSLADFLENASEAKKRNILALVMDVELRKQLDAVVPPEGKLAMETFLKSREATFGANISSELQVELQHLELEAFGDKDKCVLTFFFNIMKALGLADSELYQAPTNNKRLTIGKGVDRTQSHLFPHYHTLVSTERVKVCARRAITLFTSGLAKMQQGLLNNDEATLQAGYATIFNMVQDDGRKCELAKPAFKCTKFAPNKESAASAIYVMYMELMDFMVNPSPPLMLRKDMRVTALYKDAPFDEATYDTWDQDKKNAYREEYLKFCAKWMNVGFTFTDSRGPHGMLLLNLDSWGDDDIVVNPFRVREDEMLYKYFGAFRLLPNRLGIGKHARQVWLNHRIRYDFDPTYCDAFRQKQAWYPRPIFDLNCTLLPSDIPGEYKYSQLYCAVPMNVEQGPIAAVRRRMALESMSLKDWTQGLRELQTRTTMHFIQGTAADAKNDLFKKWFAQEDAKSEVVFSREAEAMYNIHTQFNDLRDSKLILNADQPDNKELTEPFFKEDNQGSKLNMDNVLYWSRTNRTDASTCYETKNGIQVPREAFLPPPALRNATKNALDYTSTDAKDRYFPYPVESLRGEPLRNVFPVGERKADTQTPYVQRETNTYEIFPKAETVGNEAWDLRKALCLLVGTGERGQILRNVLNAIQATQHDAVNDMNVLNQKATDFPPVVRDDTIADTLQLDCRNIGKGARDKATAKFYVGEQSAREHEQPVREQHDELDEKHMD